MNNQFCKVFDVKGHQVLYRTGTDDDGDDALITTTFIDGLYFTTTITGFEENKTTAQERLKNVDQAIAESFFEAMENLTGE